VFFKVLSHTGDDESVKFFVGQECVILVDKLNRDVLKVDLRFN